MEEGGKIRTITVVKIPEGKLEEFKQYALEVMEIVKEKDTGTCRYDWFISSDGNECEVHEEFEDIKALMEHARHVYRPGGWGDFTIDYGKVYSPIPAEYVELLKDPKAPPVKFYRLFQGLD